MGTAPHFGDFRCESWTDLLTLCIAMFAFWPQRVMAPIMEKTCDGIHPSPHTMRTWRRWGRSIPCCKAHFSQKMTGHRKCRCRLNQKEQNIVQHGAVQCAVMTMRKRGVMFLAIYPSVFQAVDIIGGCLSGTTRNNRRVDREELRLHTSDFLATEYKSAHDGLRRTWLPVSLNSQGYWRAVWRYPHLRPQQVYIIILYCKRTPHACLYSKTLGSYYLLMRLAPNLMFSNTRCTFCLNYIPIFGSFKRRWLMNAVSSADS